MRDLIRRVDTIAVVGMSRDPMKPARRIPSYLAAMGAQWLFRQRGPLTASPGTHSPRAGG